jgi:benzodiazapine receptor
LAILGVVSALVAAVSSVLVLWNAFRRSWGTGVMTLLIPCFLFYYAFAHFEHPRKGAVLAGLLGGWGLAVILAVLSGGGAVALLV